MICKNFEITRTIYSNSERAEQKKLLGFRNMQEKLENTSN